ncbi:PQQ-binding-like beta-propeller repeat protein [Cellulomonas sp. NPDC089187]|uniref:outer membrane protein assembly factor BamB family protein n=1 Tax=Cellulomonas sp. NPDC089187 TaxID=3154970 RepID=UPI003421A831
MARGGMDEVELIEDDGTTVAPASTPDRPPRDRRPGSGRLARRWWPVPVVLVAAVVLADLGTGSAEERAALHAQSLPTVARPIGPDLRIEEVDPRLTPWGGELIDGVLVLTTWDEAGHPLVTGSSPDTGDELWRTQLVTAPDSESAYTSASSADCWAEGAHLVCWSAVTRYDFTGPVGMDQVHLTRIDLHTGDLLDDRTLPPDTTVTGADGLRFTATGADGPITLAATRPGGSRLWDVTLEPPGPARGGFSDQLVIEVSDGGLRVAAPSGSWAVDRADGQVLVAGALVGESRRGRFVAQDADGLWVSSTEGPVSLGARAPVLFSADDGSMPHLEFVSGQGTGNLVAVDATTGQEEWSTQSGFVDQLSLVLIDGVLVGVVPGGLRALDASSGRERWSVQLSTDQTWSLRPVTDGRQVLVLAQQDGDPVVVALDLRSGVRMWSAPVPNDSQQLEVHDHRIFLYGETRTSWLS